jgi:molecular chaperone GrpE
MEDDKLARMTHADQSGGTASNGNGGTQDDQSASAGIDEKAQLAAEVETLRNDKRELEDKTLRLVAEMENLRRRTEPDKAEFSKYAVSEFARELLSVGDNLRRAIESVQAEAADDPALRNLLEGIEVTERELIKAFEKQQIKRFDPQGEPFNPHLHEAMTRIDVPNAAADTVVQVVQAGYMIAERILRPAAVIVAKGGSGAETPAPKKETEDPNRLPLGATMVPEEVQAEQEMAAEGEFAQGMPNASNRGEGRAASGREFQVERKRPSAAPGAVDERVSQIRRQQPRPAGSVETPRNQQASKPSALHKPVINSGNE